MNLREFTLRDNRKIKIDIDDIVRVERDINKTHLTVVYVRSELSDTIIHEFKVKERRLSQFI